MLDHGRRPSGLEMAIVAAIFAAILVVAYATSARAEQAVGLEAQGVDPQAALRNGLGLDVRDALGRPVSAAVIARQIKAATAARAASCAFASRLPRARAVLWMLEFLNLASSSWTIAALFRPWEALWALPIGARALRDASAVLALLLGPLAPLLLTAVRPSAPAFARCRRLSVSLRC